MAFNVKYRAEFEQANANAAVTSYTKPFWRIDILLDEYEGAINEVNCSASPLIIELEGQNATPYYVKDKKSVIKPSRAEIRLRSTEFQFIEFANVVSDEEYKVEIYRDIGAGNVLFWTGWVEPSVFEEPYTKQNHEFLILATDKLDKLSEIRYDNAGSLYTGQKTTMVIIADILNKLNLGLNIKSNCNIYEATMDTTAADDPFTQLTHHTEYFRELDDRTLQDEALYCDEVLTQLLAPFGCDIRQINGAWAIRRFANQDASFTERTFNSSGTYQSNTTVDPVLTLTEVLVNNAVTFSGTFAIEKPFKKIELTSNLGLHTNYLAGCWFDNNLWLGTTSLLGWSVSNVSMTYQKGSDLLGGSNAHLIIDTDGVSKAAAEYMENIGSFIKKGTKGNVNFYYRVDATGSGTPPDVGYSLVLEAIDGTVYYMDSSGNWTTSETRIWASYEEGAVGMWQQYKKNDIEIPDDGLLKIRLYEYIANGWTVTGLRIDKVSFNLTAGDYGKEGRLLTSEIADSIDKLAITNEYMIDTNMNYAPYDYRGAILSEAQIDIDTGSLADGVDEITFDFDGVLYTYPYVASPVGLRDWSTPAQLESKIQSDMALNKSNSYLVDNGAGIFSLYIFSFYHNIEAGGTSQYIRPIINAGAGLSIAVDIDNIDPSTWNERFERSQIEVGGELATIWTRPSAGDDTTLLDIHLQEMHNLYGIFAHRLKGYVMDWTNTINFGSTIKDTNDSNRVFYFQGGIFDVKQNKLKGNWIEIVNG